MLNKTMHKVKEHLDLKRIERIRIRYVRRIENELLKSFRSEENDVLNDTDCMAVSEERLEYSGKRTDDPCSEIRRR